MAASYGTITGTVWNPCEYVPPDRRRNLCSFIACGRANSYIFSGESTISRSPHHGCIRTCGRCEVGLAENCNMAHPSVLWAVNKADDAMKGLLEKLTPLRGLLISILQILLSDRMEMYFLRDKQNCYRKQIYKTAAAQEQKCAAVLKYISRGIILRKCNMCV